MFSLRRCASDCEEVIGESMDSSCFELPPCIEDPCYDLIRPASCDSLHSLSSCCSLDDELNYLKQDMGDFNDTDACSDGIENVGSVCAVKAFKSMACCINQGYKYIAVDTEFPGYPLQPDRLGDCDLDKEYAYVAVNVNQTKPIQIAFSFFDAYGNSPMSSHTWQFNMRFRLPHRSTYRPQEPVDWETIEFLANHGMRYDDNYHSGVGFGLFYSLLRASNSPLKRKDVTWISYHGLKDFAYLLRLSDLYRCLPATRTCFMKKLQQNFCKVVDLKYLQTISCNLRKGDLYSLSNKLGICYDGPKHKAGSDARLLGMAYFKALSLWFPCKPAEIFYGNIYGLGNISTPQTPLKYRFKAAREVAPGYPPLPCEYPAVLSTAFTDVRKYFVTRKKNEKVEEEAHMLSEAEAEYWQQGYGREIPAAEIQSDDC